MPNVIFRGGKQALLEGLLDGTPDLRGQLVMSGFTGLTEEDAVNVADITTVDEFDGTGYQEIDPDNVAVAYDPTANEFQWSFDPAYFNASEDAGSVDSGTDDWIGILWRLHVDGTEANDIVVAFEDTGTGNGVGTAVLYTPHADGAFYLGSA